MTTPSVSVGQRYQDLDPRQEKPRIVTVLHVWSHSGRTTVKNDVTGKISRLASSALRETKGGRGWRLLPPAPVGPAQTSGIYKFSRYFGRQGDLSGVFTATRAQIASLIGREVYFGEALGKHSDVNGVMKASDFTLVSENPEFVAMFNTLDLATGTNPLNYIEESEGESADDGASGEDCDAG